MVILGYELSMTMLIAIVGIILLVVGLIKKIKFIIKLGVIVAIVAFVAHGGLAMLGI